MVCIEEGMNMEATRSAGLRRTVRRDLLIGLLFAVLLCLSIFQVG